MLLVAWRRQVVDEGFRPRWGGDGEAVETQVVTDGLIIIIIGLEEAQSSHWMMGKLKWHRKTEKWKKKDKSWAITGMKPIKTHYEANRDLSSPM